ncbi:hypothetical protein AMECASPLE_019424 [Ameca splendens]|uniref:Uncharacterized protein n=1 Tax=Ameca splendens TaxID=208324 RepID=A0ABV1AC13_9TELE
MVSKHQTNQRFTKKWMDGHFNNLIKVYLNAKARGVNLRSYGATVLQALDASLLQHIKLNYKIRCADLIISEVELPPQHVNMSSRCLLMAQLKSEVLKQGHI